MKDSHESMRVAFRPVFPLFNGIAAIADLETEECRSLLSILGEEQERFLEAVNHIRNPHYRWPIDPLHTWSRTWEYPYVYYHLHNWLQEKREGVEFHVVDVGCGFTFMPFAISRLGCRVTGTDIDPICGEDLAKAGNEVITAPGAVQFSLTDGEVLPFSTESVDAIYCISVLEHIPNFSNTIIEMARVLKSGGILILTIDLDLRGDSQIGAAQYHLLKEQLARCFVPLLQDRTIHPADMLTSRAKPYQLKNKPMGLKLPWLACKAWMLRPLFGRSLGHLSPPLLGVEGMVLKKLDPQQPRS
jgi:SAM-dependent methyltransferase